MDILEASKHLVEIVKEDGLKGVILVLLGISCVVLFFSPACLFFALYKRDLFVNINYSVILILTLSAMLFFLFYFLSSIVIPFFCLIKCIITNKFEPMNTKKCKVYTLFSTMFLFLILSGILITGYLLKRFNEFNSITQFGIEIFLISIIIIIVILLNMWIVTILIKIITKNITKQLKEADGINKETSEIYGDISKIDK